MQISETDFIHAKKSSGLKKKKTGKNISVKKMMFV